MCQQHFSEIIALIHCHHDGVTQNITHTLAIFLEIRISLTAIWDLLSQLDFTISSFQTTYVYVYVFDLMALFRNIDKKTVRLQNIATIWKKKKKKQYNAKEQINKLRCKWRSSVYAYKKKVLLCLCIVHDVDAMLLVNVVDRHRWSSAE